MSDCKRMREKREKVEKLVQKKRGKIKEGRKIAGMRCQGQIEREREKERKL